VRELEDGGPPAVSVHAGDTLLGYAYSTYDVLRAPGYSPTPFDVVGGVTLAGQVTGAAVLFHREPYLLNDARRLGQLAEVLGSIAGLEARVGAEGALPPQHVAGATISARAMRNAVLEAAGIVLRFRTGAQPITEPTVDRLNFRPMTADALLADGSLAQVVVRVGDLPAILRANGLEGQALEVAPWGGPETVYLDLRAGYAVPPTIGRNGGGQMAYDQLREDHPEGTHALIFASNGLYDFLGTRYRNLSHRFRLERLEVRQGDRSYAFTAPDLITAGYAFGRVARIVLLPSDSGFDPLAPWSVTVLATARAPDGTATSFPLARLEYTLPAQHILLPPPPARPAWAEAWHEQRAQVAVLALALAVLSVIFAAQHRLARHRRLHRWLRLGFLSFTLVWLGWIAGAQLSIVHLINYLSAPLGTLDLGFYLAEPLIVILSVYTALSLVLIGRGVFCGWLCPFGALQEILAHVARALRLPQWNPPEAIQARAWKIKYVALALVVGLAFLAPQAGAVAAEVEPFKTAITAMFDRGLPYLVYALILLAIGLFTERAFCRFLCPLGGALAILDRLHILTLLRRRPECGTPCRLCERSCPVRAIARNGEIRMDECFQCLDCQVEYHDDRRCPPLAQLRKAAERAAGRRPAAAVAALRVPVAPAGGM
jgi:transcriptional regulator of nitric oxide reductase/NAD-dependent dihydropyrimidine dehydrogenase PreA subunit